MLIKDALGVLLVLAPNDPAVVSAVVEAAFSPEYALPSIARDVVKTAAPELIDSWSMLWSSEPMETHLKRTSLQSGWQVLWRSAALGLWSRSSFGPSLASGRARSSPLSVQQASCRSRCQTMLSAPWSLWLVQTIRQPSKR